MRWSAGLRAEERAKPWACAFAAHRPRATATKITAGVMRIEHPFLRDLGHELLIAGRATTDVAARKEIYTEIAQIVNEDPVWIYMFRLNSIWGVNKRVQGFVAPGHPGRVISSAHLWSVVEG